MEFIDTHQHLIYRERLGYGWTADIPELKAGDFSVEDYRALTAGLGVAATVFMEVGVDDADYRAEARMVAGMIAAGGTGIVAQIASCRPETDAGFVDWLDECEGLSVAGLRRILHVVPDGMSQTDMFRRNLREIGQRGLVFDMNFLARQLDIAEALARACDEQVLVLDHCGVPDIAAGAFGPWAKGIDALAALPHVQCKLSGISAYCAPGTATAVMMQPWVEHILDRFGADRIVWGSDWPVVNLGCGLPDWIAMTRGFLSRLSQAEGAAIASGTARRVYRLP